MIFGRNTAQWTGLLTAISGALVSGLPLLFPTGQVGGLPVASVIALIGIITGALGVFIMFLAGTELTPTSDPRLAIGTRVNTTDPNAVNGVVVPESSNLEAVPVNTTVVEAPAVVVDSQ